MHVVIDKRINHMHQPKVPEELPVTPPSSESSESEGDDDLKNKSLTVPKSTRGHHKISLDFLARLSESAPTPLPAPLPLTNSLLNLSLSAVVLHV